MRSDLEKPFPYRAEVKWHASDVQCIAEGRDLDWDLQMCDDFLYAHSGYLQEQLGERGFEVLEDYFVEWARDMEKELEDESR